MRTGLYVDGVSLEVQRRGGGQDGPIVDASEPQLQAAARLARIFIAQAVEHDLPLQLVRWGWWPDPRTNVAAPKLEVEFDADSASISLTFLVDLRGGTVSSVEESFAIRQIWRGVEIALTKGEDIRDSIRRSRDQI